MATYYEVPGGLEWCKANLHIIIGNKPLEEIMQFGDTWRARGHKPLVHVISPSMDGGKMWDKHEDPSGLLDNIPAHIDMLIVDFYNRNEPQLPSVWAGMAPSPQWLLWEYKGGFVRFNGDHSQFVRIFGIDPATTQGTTPPSSGGTTTPPSDSLGTDVTIHLVCPHCGKKIY
jgi:hypothetical protein